MTHTDTDQSPTTRPQTARTRPTRSTSNSLVTLTILCVTKLEPYSEPFRASFAALADRLNAAYVEYDGTDAAIIEEVLDDAVDCCPDGHILRLDDDESVPADLEQWLASGVWVDNDHWAFARRHLWPDETMYVNMAPLWPDFQTRLSTKAKSGGRGVIHVGSPYGMGWVAPAPIDHWKFLVRSKAERVALSDHYVAQGGDEGFRVFSVPEDYLLRSIPVAVDEDALRGRVA